MPKSNRPYVFKSENVKSRDFPDFPCSTVQVLQKAGYQAFFVGGCIRDLLTGDDPKDFDIVTNAKPNQIHALFKNSRIIGRRFRLVHVYARRRKETVEVATFRRAPRNPPNLASSLKSRLVERDNDFGKFHQDPYRRDFGINALYFDPRSNRLYDFVDGIKDFEARRIRSVGDPLIRFAEDPVRMLRAARFSAKLNFTIDPLIVDAIADLKHTMINVKPRRMAEEVRKLFLLGHGSAVFERMQMLGLFPFVLPMQVQSDPFIVNTLNHADGMAKNNKEMRMAMLLACFMWHTYRSYFDRLPQSNNLRELVSKAGREVFDELNDSISIPKYWKSEMLEIWELQALLESRPRRQIHSMIHAKGMRNALVCFKMREQLQDVPVELKAWWTKLLQATEKEQNNMISALPPEEKRKRRRRRRKSKRK